MEYKPEYNTPSLKMEYINSFGDKIYIARDLSDDTLDSLISAIRQCVLGFGFSPSFVNEALGVE